MNYGTNKNGFSLMEVIIAVAVIITSLVVLISLISFSVSKIRMGRSEITGISLSQEGIEIIRNIRDSNWLSYKRSPDNWRDDLGQGDWLVQYNEPGLLSFANKPLKIDSSGFYQYDDGNDTSFYRKISIEHINNNQIKVVSEVSWQEKGKSYSFRAEQVLYNWLEE